MLCRSRKLVAVAAVGLGLGALAWTSTQNLAADPEHREVAREEAILTGQVKSTVKNRQGDIDGLLLDSDQLVHFPPHLAKAVLEIVKVGDQITVIGRQEVRPDQSVVLEASSIESDGNKVTMEKPRPPHAADRRERAEETVSESIVAEMHSNPHGDIDGFTMKDGTEVRFPPHQGADLARLVKAGVNVRVAGRLRTLPRGEVSLDAERITAVQSGQTLERDEPMPPAAGPRPPRPPHGGPAAHPPGPHDAVSREILDELRAIRRLLERQQDGPPPRK